MIEHNSSHFNSPDIMNVHQTNKSVYHNLGIMKNYPNSAVTITAIPFPGPTQGTLKPALKPKVEFGLTMSYIIMYGVLFSMVYVQLWMIWYYRHKRFSYQTVFLYLSVFWSGLRVTLFAFYFKDCSTVNQFPFFTYWLMFCFPVCLQFVILCLLVLFFAQVVFKARAKYEPSKFKRPLKIFLCVAIITFFAINISCAVVTNKYQKGEASWNSNIYTNMVYVRVAVNDALFMTMSIILSVCIYKMAKVAAASVVLEAKGTTVCKALVTCVLIVFLYLSRAIYNLIAVCPLNRKRSRLPSFGYGWINVTDQADFVELDHGYAYVSFALVLFVWEILPMFIVIVFFRVRFPGSSDSLKDLPSHNHDRKSYFFDNPRRYDSEEDVRGDHYHSYHSEISQQSYSINASGDTAYGSPDTLRPHRLGYGAVMTSDRQYSYSVSPVVTSTNTHKLGSSH